MRYGRTEKGLTEMQKTDKRKALLRQYERDVRAAGLSTYSLKLFLSRDDGDTVEIATVARFQRRKDFTGAISRGVVDAARNAAVSRSVDA
jgi:hypothetical protein